MRKYNAIVVGSGCVGLAAALELITAGKKTVLIEKHNLPGGCASSFCRGRFEFEPLLHELCGVGPESNPGDVRKLMDRFGVKVQWNRVDDCFRCISTYSDGTPMDVTLPTGIQAFIEKTEEYVPGSREKMTKFFDLLRENKELVEHIGSPKVSPAKTVSGVFKINENAKRLHPDYQKMTIEEVIDHSDAEAKTFILSADTTAYFRAGRYLSVSLNIGESVLTRPYSISSAPSLSKKGKYAITVRRTPGASMLCIKKKHRKTDASFGRGRRARTLGTRFWRPLLYQLSYTPISIKLKNVKFWWAIRDSNPGPTGYEPVALTN